MADQGFNHWKMTAIGLGLVVATGIVTGVVVASWSGRDAEPKPAVRVTARPASTPKVAAVVAVPAPVAVATVQASVPSQAAIDACNQHAASHTSQRSNTKEIVIDGAIGAMLGGGGALYGVNENRKNEARYREIYASCLKSRGYGS